jgi:hypothetical protein
LLNCYGGSWHGCCRCYNQIIAELRAGN